VLFPTPGSPRSITPVRVPASVRASAAPQLERAFERLERRFGGQPGGRAHAALEALGVDLLGGDREPVAGSVADEQQGWRAAVAVRLQERAQVGHAHRERTRDQLVRHALPGGVEQRGGGDRATRLEQQPREDRALLRAGWGGGRECPATSILPRTRKSMGRPYPARADLSAAAAVMDP